jgi:hypothetical protein
MATAGRGENFSIFAAKSWRKTGRRAKRSEGKTARKIIASCPSLGVEREETARSTITR